MSAEEKKYRRMARALGAKVLRDVNNAIYPVYVGDEKLYEGLVERNATLALHHAKRSHDVGNRFPICDCAASGNAAKPKQHGADPHAKNCAVYIGNRS